MDRLRHNVSLTIAAMGLALSSCTVVPMEKAPGPAAGFKSMHCAKRDVEGCETHLAYEAEPGLISMSAAEYPDAARQANVGGEVFCHAYVDIEGRVAKAHVLQVGNPALDDASLRAVRGAVFEPALRKDGSKVAAWTIVRFSFAMP